MKNFTLFILLFAFAGFVNAQDFPINFETGSYTFTDFDGGVVTVIDNPHSVGINTSKKVAQMVKNEGQTWAGSKLSLANTIDFTTNKVFTMKVYSPRVGVPVLLKLENGDGTVSVGLSVSTTVANEWELLSFDFSGNTSGVYNNLVFFFENGVMGNGSANWTFLFDDIEFSPSSIPAVKLPIDFEAGPYGFRDFDGGVVTVIANPQSSGINTSATVAQMVKNEGQTWAGSKLVLDNTIDFTDNQVFTMKVYSPRVNVPVLLKLENGNGSVTVGLSVSTTVANKWETLSFDFSGNTSGVYNSLVFFFENGVMGDGSANWTFLFDDIEFSPSSIPPLKLPIDFETGPYGFHDFDGGVATVIANPQSSGINTSATVAQMVKGVGQTWAGSKLVLDNMIDFSAGSTFTMKVYSPRVNVPVLLKLENGDGSVIKEISANTTVANEWETLSFDFSGSSSGVYNNLVFFFENGVMGDGSANWTFLFDDIELKGNTGGLSRINLPVTFEDSTVNYEMTDFGGNVSVITADPTDSKNNVAKVTKTTGAETWAGTTIGTASGYATVIPFSPTRSKISIRVFSPAIGIHVRLKVEAHDNETLTAETETLTTIANAWETLTFDLSKVATGTNPWNPATKFDKMSVFFDFGNRGTGAVYYFDDVVFVVPTQVENINSNLVNIYSGNGKIHVNGIAELVNGTIDVYEITGRKMFAKKITSGNEIITTNKTGIFIVRISNGNQFPVLSRKVVIN